MKKRIKLLLFVILFVPMLVYADMGSPMIKPYQMVVVSTDGIDYYDYDGNVKGHLNKDDTFTVQYEYNGGYNISIPGNETSFNLKDLTGIMLVQDELKPEEAMKDEKNNGSWIKKVSSKNNALVYAEEGVDVRKGPSTVYDKVGHLDKDTKIKYLYSLDGGGTTHIYVNSNGVKGWIDILESKVLLETSEKFIAFKDINLSCATVPKNTILTGKYVTDPWSRKVLVEYGKCSDLYYYFRGIEGLIDMHDANYKSKDSLDIYEYYNNEGDKLGTIPNDTYFKAMASAGYQGEDNQYLYVKYDGKEGWIKATYDKFEWIDKEVVDNSQSNSDVITDGDSTDSEIIGKPELRDDVVEKTPYDTTLIYVIIGVVVALMALVTIILVNRKKKSSEEIINNEKKIDIDFDEE